MLSYEDRESRAMGIYEQGLDRVQTAPDPVGQKFPSGSRVRIADDLGHSMRGFTAGANATVEYTHAHAYGGSKVDKYSLMIDGHGSSSWYEEHQLTAIVDEDK